MKEESILLLSYYYNIELINNKLLKYVKNRCGVYLPWDIYLFEPLKRIFSKVILYDYLERTAEIGVKAVNQEVISIVRQEHPKYVLWTSFYYDILGSTLDQVRQEGSIVIGWFFDDEWRFDPYSKWWIPHLDYFVTNARDAVPKYRELNAGVILTIPNTGVPVALDWNALEEKHDVSFTGTRYYADRDQWIKEIQKRGVHIDLFGTGWGRYISFEEMIQVFSTSRINLNFSKTVHDLTKLQIKGRIFQVCLAGGFLLTEYAPGIEDYFEIGREVVCFQNTKELAEKIDYYLSHESERRAIAMAGWVRATREYSSGSMVEKVFLEIEEETSKKPIRIKPPASPVMLPKQTLKNMSDYHLEWGMAFLAENHKGLWKDSLALSRQYDPFNIQAGFHVVVSLLPAGIRPLLIAAWNFPGRFFRKVITMTGTRRYLQFLKQFYRKHIKKTA